MSLLNTVKTLCSLSGPAGFEDEVRDYILERALPHADEISTDPMGNLIVFKKGRVTPAERIMLCAHMDEVGLIITHITDDGFLKFDFLGGIDVRVIIGKRVFVGENRLLGIIGNVPVHLLKSGEEDKAPERDSLYIDIGAGSRKEAEKLVSLGDTAVFDNDIFELGGGLIRAKALDDRFGCAVLLELLENEGEIPCDCYFVFTTQEEAGLRGALTAAYNVRPDIALVVEGTTAADLPGVSESKEVCCVGGGAVIPFMDRSAVQNPSMWRLLTEIAQEHGIKWQTKRRISGGTDSAAIQKTAGGVKTCVAAIPVRNIHSPSSVADTGDFDSVFELCKRFLEKMGGEASDN